MIKVVKFYKPLQLDPGETGQFTVEDEIHTAKFVFLPELRVYNTSPAIGGDACHLEIKHIFAMGFGDDPLWSGNLEYIVVNEDIPPGAFRAYNFTPQLDKAEVLVTRHIVSITNLGATEQRIVKSLLFGLSETQIQLGNDSGVIVTQQPNV